jgi:hypothetical protein
MSKDIFGFEQTIESSNRLASSAAASLIFDNQALNLAQNVQWQYGSQTSVIMEIGSSNVMHQSGRPSGRLEIQRLVGEDGFYSHITGDESGCGALATISITLKQDKCAADIKKNKVLNFGNCRVEAVSGGMSADNLRVIEGVSCLITKMQRTS